jgi:DNA-binding NarL/FixJ family response regulator
MVAYSADEQLLATALAAGADAAVGKREGTEGLARAVNELMQAV